MVKRSPQDSEETHAPQESEQDNREPNKIGAATPFDFSGKNLTPYGGLLPVATMLEKLGFQQLVEETLAVYPDRRSTWTATGSGALVSTCSATVFARS